MDPLTNLYIRLRQQANGLGAETSRSGETSWPEEPPRPDAWMRYWNDDDSYFGNLSNFEHWLSRARRDA